MLARLASNRVVNVPLRLLVLLAVGPIVLAACAPGPVASRQDQPTTSAPQRVKTLRIGTIKEPVQGIAVSPGSAGNIPLQHSWMFHQGLTTFDSQGSLQPAVASKVPSIAVGDWKVNPDGTTDVTWKLRANAKWHDGTPLSAEDFVFGIRVAADPDLPLPRLVGIRFMREISAPDAQTLVVHWAETYYGANRGGPYSVPAVPRHIMEDLYRQGDKQVFINSPYWTTQFVGLGPYRLGEWVQGSSTEALAFDDYFLGRPKIDRVILRYYNDRIVMATSLLAGDIDLVGMGNLTADDLSPVRTAWEASGDGTIIKTLGEIVWARFQFREPSAPWVRDVRVRQALVHMIDRQTFADAFEPGGSAPADLFVSPDDPAYRLAEQRGFAKYPYDANRTSQLLADAGWTRGADGMLQDRAGQRFTMETRVIQRAQPMGVALADQFKRGGLDVPFSVILDNAENRGMQRATSQGVYLQSDPNTEEVAVQFTTAEIRGERNNWAGLNQSGYSNPAVDQLYAQLARELDPTKHQAQYADFLKFAADEVLFLPVFYSSGFGITAFRRGLRGPGPVAPIEPVTTWNIQAWDMD